MTDSKMTLDLTIGVITHDRSHYFSHLLGHLRIAIDQFHSDCRDSSRCKLIIVNNTGVDSRPTVQRVISDSGITAACDVKLIDSPKNNIAVGRNLILDNTETRWLVFVDDDEYPTTHWLILLIEQQIKTGCAVVAGPIEPVYPPATTSWVAAVDLHNKGTLKTNDRLTRVATGNCLLDLEQIEDHRFDPEFGLSGGSDALFFDQLAERGLEVVWREDAIVYETIPDSRTSSKYMIFRCMTQGQNFKRVVLRNANLGQKIQFLLKALLIAPPSLLIGLFSLPINSPLAAFWLKRGFTNLGKLIRIKKKLYG